MPHRRLPNTVSSVIRILKTARDNYLLTSVAAERAINDEQWAALDPANPASFLNRYLKEVSDVDLALATQAPLTSQLSQTGARLTMFVSHFHQVLDLGVARGDYQTGARSYYGRDINAGSIPDLSTYDNVGEAAENIVTGEAARQTAEGAAYRAMSNPSMEDVGAIWEQFTLLRGQSKTAQKNTDDQREEAGLLYNAAQKLAVDICDTVEFFYRKDLDGASFRTKCERWGVVYIFDQNETPVVPPVTPPVTHL